MAQTIDFHTHAQPSAPEGIAFQRQWGHERPPRTGVPEELLAIMDRAGIAQSLLVPWMPAQDHADRLTAAMTEGGLLAEERARAHARRIVAETWRRLNQWAVETVAAHPDRLLCLVGLDPLVMDESFVRQEAADRLAQGACGLKIAPMFLRAPPDDPRMAIVFQLAQEHGVFALAQAGAHGYQGQPAWGHPRHFEPVLKAYPDVIVQLAHLGMGAEEEVAGLTARYPNLYADLSSRMHLFGQPGQWSLAEAAAWIRRIGVERVLFGTNYPLNDPVLYVQVMEALPLTGAERQAVLFENAQRILAKNRPRRPAPKRSRP